MSVHQSSVRTPAPQYVKPLDSAPDSLSVFVTGEVDLATAPTLRSTLMDAIASPTPLVVDVDLSACTFLDCAGIGVLVAARARAHAVGCELWVTHPRRIVRVVLEAANLLDAFTAPGPRTAPTAGGGDNAATRRI